MVLGIGRRKEIDLGTAREELEEKQEHLLKQLEGIDLGGNRGRGGRFWLGLLLGGAAGAGLLYLFDPEKGEERRQGLLGAASSLGGDGGDTTDQDQAVTDRVQMQLFGDPSIPKGQMNINTVDGVVYVRGTATSQEQIAEIERRIKGIEGVDAVINLLRLPAPA